MVLIGNSGVLDHTARFMNHSETKRLFCGGKFRKNALEAKFLPILHLNAPPPDEREA
jgi:hypothetical protein